MLYIYSTFASPAAHASFKLCASCLTEEWGAWGPLFVPLVTTLLVVYRENGGHFEVKRRQATFRVHLHVYTCQND